MAIFRRLNIYYRKTVGITVGITVGMQVKYQQETLIIHLNLPR